MTYNIVSFNVVSPKCSFTLIALDRSIGARVWSNNFIVTFFEVEIEVIVAVSPGYVTFIFSITRSWLNWRELFDGYLIMYFSQKNILFFLIYFFVKPSFWKSKNTNRLHFWRGLRISISFWLNRKKEVVMTKRRLIAIKLIGSYMRIYMYFIEQWDYIIKNIWKIIFKY